MSLQLKQCIWITWLTFLITPQTQCNEDDFNISENSHRLATSSNKPSISQLPIDFKPANEKQEYFNKYVNFKTLDDELAKRKWSNSMQTWGKRSERDKSGVERDINGLSNTYEEFQNQQISGNIENNDINQDIQDLHKPSMPNGRQKRDGEIVPVQKRWGNSKMDAWGKRGANGLSVNENEPYSISKRWGSHKISVWGKRDADEKYLNLFKNSDDLEQQDTDDVSQLINSLTEKLHNNGDTLLEEFRNIPSKKWSGNKMATWGKRSNDYTLDKKWGNDKMSAWGKRAVHFSEIPEVKRWGQNKMSAWGKRATGDVEFSEFTKRWGDNKMAAWGKRNEIDSMDKKWKQSGMSAWGKRADSSNLEPNHDILQNVPSFEQDNDMLGTADKKWANQQMSAWGKRSDILPMTNLNKKWNNKNLSAWGKRSTDSDEDIYKRWEHQRMSAWGKRSDFPSKPWYNNVVWIHNPSVKALAPNFGLNRRYNVATTRGLFNGPLIRKRRSIKELFERDFYENSDAQLTHEMKRMWDPFNALRAWAKRTKMPQIGPKRGWQGSNIRTVWGKRSSENNVDDSMNSFPFTKSDLVFLEQNSEMKRAWEPINVWG